jgi:hypothetical protein
VVVCLGCTTTGVDMTRQQRNSSGSGMGPYPRAVVAAWHVSACACACVVVARVREGMRGEVCFIIGLVLAGYCAKKTGNVPEHLARQFDSTCGCDAFGGDRAQPGGRTTRTRMLQ